MDARAPRAVASVAERVCLRCGLCCDGALFARVPLGEDEAPPARLVVLAAPRRFPQPCAALEDLACAVYAERPAACRRYRCLLLGALDEGEVDEGDAHGVVAEAHARIAAVAAALGADAGPSGDVLAAARRGPPTEALARAEAWLDQRFGGVRR